MSYLAIRVENLGKRYRIGQAVGYKTLRSSITSAFTAPFRRSKTPLGIQPHSGGHSNTIWALKNVSFEVKHGEAVGIIGRNGSGKSTLLKVLSRITAPTEGFAEIHGRVGSLLEVGTGFHPELTGRENIYLNGAVLGMKRAEVIRKFDEIVAFAEVEKFLDTPVKHYSSGMYVRLAFAVAAHLEPEILIVDEVLAVGDMAFQRKCLGKMDEVTRGGRTILLVSHQMTFIGSLCKTVFWLDQGSLKMSGSPEIVISQYQKETTTGNNRIGNRIVRAKILPKRAWIDSVQIEGEGHKFTTSFEYGQSFQVIVSLKGTMPKSGYLEWTLKNEAGVYVTSGGTFMVQDFKIPVENAIIGIKIGPLPLALGSYYLGLKIGELPGYPIDDWDGVETISIIKCVIDPGGFSFESKRGSVYVPAQYYLTSDTLF